LVGFMVEQWGDSMKNPDNWAPRMVLSLVS